MAGQFTQWDLCKECNVISIYGSGHFATVLNDIKSVLATIKESVLALIIDTFIPLSIRQRRGMSSYLGENT